MRAAYERDIAPLVESNGLGVVPYFALVGGVLTGKYRGERDLVGAERAQLIAAFDFLRNESLPVIELVSDIAATHSTTAAAASSPVPPARRDPNCQRAPG